MAIHIFWPNILWLNWKKKQTIKFFLNLIEQIELIRQNSAENVNSNLTAFCYFSIYSSQLCNYSFVDLFLKIVRLLYTSILLLAAKFLSVAQNDLSN